MTLSSSLSLTLAFPAMHAIGLPMRTAAGNDWRQLHFAHNWPGLIRWSAGYSCRGKATGAPHAPPANPDPPTPPAGVAQLS